MGQAKQKGTFEQRKAMAIERNRPKPEVSNPARIQRPLHRNSIPLVLVAAAVMGGLR